MAIERSFDPTVINPATNAPGRDVVCDHARQWQDHPARSQCGTIGCRRVGFAYLLGTKTTIRGGFGMYTFPWNVDTYASDGLGNAFTTSGNEADSTNNVQPVVILSSDGNTNYQGAKGTAINALYRRAPTTPDAYNGQAVDIYPVHVACSAAQILELHGSAPAVRTT